MESSLSKFADGTKLRGVIHQVVVHIHWVAVLQYFDRLVKWAEKNLMKFSKGNAKPCTWKRTTPGTSTDWVEASWLESSSAEKDLGLLAVELTTSQPCTVTAGQQHPGLPWISMVSRSLEVTLPFYSAVVRLHLKSCVQFWAHQCRKDMGVLMRELSLLL